MPLIHCHQSTDACVHLCLSPSCCYPHAFTFYVKDTTTRPRNLSPNYLIVHHQCFPGCRVGFIWVGHGKFHHLGTSLAVQRLRLRLPLEGAWVRSLVGELRAHTPSGVAKKIIFIKKKKIPSPFLLLKTHGVYFSISKARQVDWLKFITRHNYGCPPFTSIHDYWKNHSLD